MEKLILNTGWQFAKLPGQKLPQAVNAAAADQAVDLPHTWYRDEDQYRGLTVYQKTVSLPDLSGKCLFLEIGAADHTVTAYAGGVELGSHKGGYSRVRFAVPPSCLTGGALDLTLYVDNGTTEDVSPLAGDFTVFGGLTRGVSLLVTEPTHFDYCYYGTDGVLLRTHVNEKGDGVIEVEPHVICAEGASDVKVLCTVLDPDGNVVASGHAAANTAHCLTVPHVRLWNGKADPALYTVTYELAADGATVDEGRLTTGFKRIALDSDRGFFLNGQHLRVQGVAKHQDFAGVFSAVTEAHIDRDFELIDEIGANAIRLSHYQHPQRTYDLCDEKGYVVWAEIPMLKMTEDPALQQNAKQQLTELILQNLHHPSICFWGVQNEIAMFRDAPFVHDNVRELAALAKALDPNRLITCANLHSVKAKSMLNRLTDMVGYNIYFGWYYGKMEDYGPYLDKLHADLPEVPLGISEYGVDAATWLHAENPLVKDYSEEFEALWHQTVYPILQSRDYLWGSFIWNMFDFSSSRRDEGGQKFINAKGLVTFDRQIKKDPFYYYKAKWSKEPFVHLCQSRFTRRCRDTLDVKVYTNLPEATLTGANGVTVTAANDGNGAIVFAGVPLHEGENLFRVHAGALEQTIRFEKVAAPEESYTLPNSGAGSTVQNWFLAGEDIDPDLYFSLSDRAEDLLENEEAHRVLKAYLPAITGLLEKGAIPLGLAMTSILSRDQEIAEKVDLEAMNRALLKISKE